MRGTSSRSDRWLTRMLTGRASGSWGLHPQSNSLPLSGSSRGLGLSQSPAAGFQSLHAKVMRLHSMFSCYSCLGFGCLDQLRGLWQFCLRRVFLQHHRPTCSKIRPCPSLCHTSGVLQHCTAQAARQGYNTQQCHTSNKAIWLPKLSASIFALQRLPLLQCPMPT